MFSLFFIPRKLSRDEFFFIGSQPCESNFSGTSGYPIPLKPLRVTSPNLQLCPPKEFRSISSIASEEFDSQGWLPIKKNSSWDFKITFENLIVFFQKNFFYSH